MHSNTAVDSPARLLEILSESALEDELLSQIALTCCAVTLSQGGKVTLASAGHPPPLRIGAKGAEALPVGGMLPGLLPSATYQPLSIRLAPGERIALYTDGLFESASDETGRRELEAHVIKTLTDSLDQPLDQSLEQAMLVFDQIAGIPPNDDALLVVMEPID